MDYSGCERFITTIVEILKNQDEKQFMLEFEFEAKRTDEIKIPTRRVNLLVDARSNYIGIWLDKSGKRKWDLTPKDFEFQSCHDTCWRTDGMRWIFKNYIEMRDDLYSQLEKKNGTMPNLAEVNGAISLSPFIFFKTYVEFKTKGRTEIVDFRIK